MPQNKHRSLAAITITLALLAGPLLSSPAQAADNDLVYADQTRTILGLLKGYGTAELKRDDDGDPKISGKIEGISYEIYFYGCRNGRNCQDIQFYAGWNKRPHVTLKVINDWNKNKRFGKVYLRDDQGPSLELVVNLRDGVSRKNLDDTIDWWRVIAKEFRDEVVDD